MVTLVFPDFDALHLAIASGAVPEAVSRTAADGAVAEDGSVAVQTAAPFPRAALPALERLGVRLVKSLPQPPTIAALCWPQLLPVRRIAQPVECGPQTAVLFELERESQLPELVTEILRLGNDRQSFRQISAGPESRALLHVVGPPYYSLLRALEESPAGTAPRAYLRHAERVWVQAGYTHPLAERLRPAANQLVLLGPPHRWTLLDEAEFRDIYEVLTFTLPQAPTAWCASPPAGRIRVPLRLAPGGPPQDGELWVLDEDGVAQLDALANAADDALLARWAFAVGESEGRRTVVLRVRPSKEPPPVLVLRGVAYRSYLKLANLFLPVGQRLHPPLRRETVAKLLAPQRGLITWLAPGAGNRFTPHSLPDDAFRPLSDWVDYVLDHEHAALQAWMASTRFDFERFVCGEDTPPPAVQAPSQKGSARDRAETAAAKAKATAPIRQPPQETPPSPASPQRAEEAPPAEAPPAPLGQAEQRLRELEAQFAALDCPPDAAERRPLWREMARLNAALAHRRDATVCWSNALWEEHPPAPDALRAWLADEERTLPRQKLSAGDLSALLAAAETRPIESGALAAYVVWAAQQESPPVDLTKSLGAVAGQLERQETNLPLRAAWLAWQAVARLSGGDVLTLAKARDRALERLYQQGLRPEFDLPSFLRPMGPPDTERFCAVRDHLARLHQDACRWLAQPPAEGETAAYADLMFAYGWARLGEVARTQELLAPVERKLAAKDEIHRWLGAAFAHRIRAAKEGPSRATPFPDELLAALQTMEAAHRYKIEKLRNESRILEPFEKLNAYRRFVGKYLDELGQRLLRLIDEHDREKLAAEARTLLREHAARAAPAEMARILAELLQLAPRLGETFARESLALVPPTLAGNLSLADQALLLERGLLLAAHFDQGDYVQTFVDRFHQLLASGNGNEVAGAFDSLVTHCFKSLRKLGMRDAMDGIFRQLTDLLRQVADARGRPPSSWFAQQALQAAGDLARSRDLMQVGKVLLQVADGQFYYGQVAAANELLDEVRAALLQGKLAEFWRLKLAAAYLGALAQAPVEDAVLRIGETFAHLTRDEARNSGTMTHFGMLELNVVEAAILALVGDGFQLDAQGRKWLEEDEFVVRRRIHRDVRDALAHESSP